MIQQSQVSAFRLKRHHFLDENRSDVGTISQDVCGFQAQVMAAAQLAMWARMHDLTRVDIHSALWQTRSLVKTSAMRGTLHLLAATDFDIYISALKKSRIRQTLQIMSRYGVTQREAYRVMEAVVEALSAGPMARRELTGRILSMPIAKKRARAWFEQSWWGVVRQAMVEGFICYGPDQGQEVTLVRVDQWLPKNREVPEQEAKRVLLRRYLRAYGPATAQDFARWAGVSMQEVKPVWKSLQDELAEVQCEDQKGFVLGNDLERLTKSSSGDPVLRLLPSFDPDMLAHVNKSHLVGSSYYKRVYRQAGWISPVILLNGRVVGTWSYVLRGDRLFLEIAPFENFPRTTRRKIEEESASLARFLEVKLEASRYNRI